jgi:hypothetical protein
MLGFREWLIEEAKKPKKKDKKNESPSHQGSREVGNVDNQREADRFDQEIKPPVVHYFPEP